MVEPTRLEAMTAAAKQRPLEWNPSREARVWSHIDAQLNAPVARPARWRLAFCALAGVASLAIGLAAWRGAESPVKPELLRPSEAFTTMSFPGDATGFAAAEAHAEVVEATASEVRVRQRQGRIEYQVTPGRPRRFVVDAEDVEVTVLGTAFLVAVEDGQVRVDVSHGRVQVRRRGDTVILGAGESLQLAREPVEPPSTPSNGFEPDGGGPVASVVPSEPAGALGEPPDSPAAAPTVPEAGARPRAEWVLKRADALRSDGKYDAAAKLLRTFVEAQSNHPKLATALFTLGRVEQSRGRFQAAAEAFARCVAVEPKGPIAEDASAEAAFAWSRAGAPGRASDWAKKTLTRFPHTIHRPRLEAL